VGKSVPYLLHGSLGQALSGQGLSDLDLLSTVLKGSSTSHDYRRVYISGLMANVLIGFLVVTAAVILIL
jgi:hypothetical protein